MIGGKEVSETTTTEYFKGKVLLTGFPGAFTPTCTNEHLPEYISKQLSDFKGISKIAALAVHDPFVMQTYAEHLNAKGKID